MASLQTVSRAKDKQFRALGVTEDFSFYLPPGHQITGITVYNRTANAVTGGINIGTTAGGNDIVAAFAVGANELTAVADASILKKIFSLTSAQEIFISDVSAWNNANIDVWFRVEKLRP